MCPGNLGYYNLGTEQSAWSSGRMGTQNSCFGYLQSLGKMGSGKVDQDFLFLLLHLMIFQRVYYITLIYHQLPMPKIWQKNEEKPGLTWLKPIFRLISISQKRFQLSIPSLA